MDQQAEYPEEPIYEPEEVQEYENATVAPPLECLWQILREYRLLNSLLLSLLVMIVFFVAMWNFIIYVAIGGEGDSDFSDGGAAPAQQQQEKQKVVKLMQRQQKTPPTAQQTFRTTAISGHHPARLQRTRRQGPVPRGQRPSSFDRKRQEQQRRHEERSEGHWLVTAQDHAQRCDPRKDWPACAREEERK